MASTATVAELSATSPEMLQAMGQLLRYPREGYLQQVAQAERDLAAHDTDACQHLRRFADALAHLGEGAALAARLEEVYTRTFDLAPSCVPYVSVHLFGTESFKRAELMARLVKAFRDAGVWQPGELPDHIAVLLSMGPALDAREWRDLVRYLLLEPLQKMRALLDESDNPYAHLLAAVETLLARGRQQEVSRA